MSNISTDFNQFEIIELWAKFGNEAAINIGCTGKLEEKPGVRTATKKCGSKIIKEIHRGDGTVEVKITGHCKYSVYNKAFGMTPTGLKTGVHAYGYGSAHPEFLITAKVKNEDGDVMYKAYPRCGMSDTPTIVIDNESEDVAAVELTMRGLPDDNNMCMYNAVETELTDNDVKTSWLSNFSASLVSTSATAPVTPTIGTDLSSTATGTAGSNKTLTIAASVTDDGTLRYQWYKDGESVAGANSDSYTLSNPSSGTYDIMCIVTNHLGGATAAKASTVCALTIS